MLCPKCKKEISDGTQFCPGCGENLSQKTKKQKKPITKKWWFWVLIVVIAIAFMGIVSDSEDSDSPADNNSVVQTEKTTVGGTTVVETTKEITTEKPTISESDYKSSCVSVSYKDIARQPDSYKGKDIMFTGEVMQVQESNYSNSCVLLIYVNKNQYGNWDDLVYVTYTMPDGAPRILEDDIVKFYGECEGTYTYSTAMGSTNTVPRVSAHYIDIQ